MKVRTETIAVVAVVFERLTPQSTDRKEQSIYLMKLIGPDGEVCRLGNYMVSMYSDHPMAEGIHDTIVEHGPGNYTFAFVHWPNKTYGVEIQRMPMFRGCFGNLDRIDIL